MESTNDAGQLEVDILSFSYEQRRRASYPPH